MSLRESSQFGPLKLTKVVLREATPESGLDEMVACLYHDKIIIAAGASGMIVLTPEESVKLAAAITKRFPLDALGTI